MSERDRRHEVKLVTTRSRAGHVAQWLRTSAFGFRVAHQDRSVHNLYFDSAEADALAEKLAGDARRLKVRYRWYGEATRIGPGQLEVKHRVNGVGWKDTFAVPQPPAGAGRARFVRELRALLPPQARRFLDEAAEPTLINAYQRSYFVSADGAVRATVDRELHVFDQRRGPFPRLRGGVSLAGLVVLELKFPPELRARVGNDLGDLALIASACSKYELGLRAVAEL